MFICHHCNKYIPGFDWVHYKGLDFHNECWKKYLENVLKN